MKKIFVAVALALSLTSCAEITEGLRDISQGTFAKNRLPNPVKQGSSFYDSIVNLSQGKITDSTVKMETSDYMVFKSLNSQTLIQANKVTYDYDQVELLTTELKRHNIVVKKSGAGKKCESPISNKNNYLSETHEFIFNGKKMYILTSGTVCGSCLYNPVIITRSPPCKVLDAISF